MINKHAARFEFTISTAILLVIIIGGWFWAYYTVFSQFAWYDDEGFFMITVKEYLKGLLLYDQVYTPYGPFFYIFKGFFFECLGIPLSHDITRLLCIGNLLLVALGCSWITSRLTRSLLLASLVFLQSIAHLTAGYGIGITREPGHPQELGLILITAVLVFSFYVEHRRRERLSMILIGILTAALFLTKVNLGVYVFLALILALLMFTDMKGAARTFVYLAPAGVAFAPLILMREHLNTSWGMSYCLTCTFTILPVLITGFTGEHTKPIHLRHHALLYSTFIMTLLVLLMVVVFQGTSIQSLVKATLLEPLMVPSLFAVPARIYPIAVLFGMLSLGLLSGYLLHYRRRKILNGRFVHFITLLKVILGLGVLLSALSSGHGLLNCCAPFLWLLMVQPKTRDRLEFRDAFPRNVLCMITAMLLLVGYPVFGSQSITATLFLIPAGFVSFGDAVSSLLSDKGKRIDEMVRRRGKPVLSAGLAGGLIVFYYFVGPLNIRAAKERYEQLTPLGLPGAERVHLDADSVEKYHWLVENLRTHADSFLTVPGVNSLYFWTEMEPVTGKNIPHDPTWLTWLNIREQEEIVQEISGFKRACIVYSEKGFSFFYKDQELDTSPIFNHIRDSFVTAYQKGHYHIMVRRDRGAP